MLDKCRMIDSGIEWVGDIPQDWLVFPAGGVFSEVKEKNTNNEYSNAFSFRYGEIVDKKTNGIDDGSVDEALSAYRVVSPNTIMINGLNLNYDFITQRVAIVKEKGIITSAYLAVQPDERLIVPKFALYLFKAYDAKQVFHGMGSGVRKTLKYSDFKHIKIVAPSMDKQKTIVAYLDGKMQEIEGIIAEAKASIEEYKAWKASIIYEAVTKGLDPNAEMKDSGIEWFGMIPQHWFSMKLRYALENISDVDHFMPESVSEGIPYIMTGDLEKMVSQINVEECKKISVEDYRKLSQKSKIQIDDVIFARYATIGTVSYVDVDLDCIISYSCVVVSPKKDVLSGKYLYYYLQSEAFASEVGKYINTNIQGNVGKESMYKAKILLPPITEQTIIVDHLDRKCQALDSLIAEKEALIKDMEAYKKSLIFEVVTGKRKVV